MAGHLFVLRGDLTKLQCSAYSFPAITIGIWCGITGPTSCKSRFQPTKTTSSAWPVVRNRLEVRFRIHPQSITSPMPPLPLTPGTPQSASADAAAR
jgi:hypothetical protein